MKSTITFSPPIARGYALTFFTPSILGVFLCVGTGVILGFFMSHGLHHPYDKGIHVVFFSLFMFFCATSVRELDKLAIVSVLFLAVGTELLQGMAPGRAVSLMDGGANFAGCLIGFWLYSKREAFFRLCDQSPFFKGETPN